MDIPYPERSTGHRSPQSIDGAGEDEEDRVSGIEPAGTRDPAGRF